MGIQISYLHRLRAGCIGYTAFEAMILDQDLEKLQEVMDAEPDAKLRLWRYHAYLVPHFNSIPEI